MFLIYVTSTFNNIYILIVYKILSYKEDTNKLLMSKIERINETYSVGYKTYDKEFGGYGETYVISSFDTMRIEDIITTSCSYSNQSPNGRYAFFETLDIGWVFRSEVDSFLHDKWYGALVDLQTADVILHCTTDCGDEWNEFNFWMQDAQIIFNGNDTIRRSNETVYSKDEVSNTVSWISYHENGQVKETGQSSEDIFACGMNVGTHYFYSEDGHLVKTISYSNWIPEEGDGCHSVIQDKYISEFEKYYTLRYSKMYQSVYEGDEYKTGVWLEFDKDGKLVSSHNYGMKYVP